MLERTASDQIATTKPPALLARRLLFSALVGLTIVGMIWLAVIALSPGGLGVLDLVLRRPAGGRSATGCARSCGTALDARRRAVNGNRQDGRSQFDRDRPTRSDASPSTL